MSYTNIALNQQNMKTMEAYIAGQQNAYNFTTTELTPDILDKTIADARPNTSNMISYFTPFGEIERPSTPEVKQHDQIQELWMAIYDFLHPEPEPDSPVLSSITGGSHAHWEKERAKAIGQWEETYRENNPEYARQIEEYEQQIKEESKRTGILM